jgi:hypothetical protein
MLNFPSNYNILQNDLIGYHMMFDKINMHNIMIQLSNYILFDTLIHCHKFAFIV